MQRVFVRVFLVLLSILPLQADEKSPPGIDQFHLIFGTSGYVLYKVLDFANDHGYRYAKIISFEFLEHDHKMQYRDNTPFAHGRVFEIKDDHSMIVFSCFNEECENPCIIDLEKYRAILDSIAIQVEG